jgi:hypothetical protein
MCMRVRGTTAVLRKPQIIDDVRLVSPYAQGFGGHVETAPYPLTPITHHLIFHGLLDRWRILVWYSRVSAGILRPMKMMWFRMVGMTGIGLLMLGCFNAPSEGESPAGATYYIHPVAGEDQNNGRAVDRPWKTFAPVNQMQLKPGDRVEVLAPGSFDQSLIIKGTGTAEQPIEIHFAPGRYDIFPDQLERRQYHISNTNADPEGHKAIAILFDGAKHIHLSGPGARLVCRGKMMHVCVDSSENITITDLAFDYHRPTVSEFKVTAVSEETADLEVHPDSTYRIEDGKVIWVGEGWEHEGELGQVLDVETGELRRRRHPLQGLTVEEIEPFKLRANGKHDLKAGRIYQIRRGWRDYAAVFTRRSKDIVWRDVNFYFLHGMGLVSQFSENLTFENVSIAPDRKSGRIGAAWADCLHVSGCRGKIIVKDCLFSGAQDDAINIHGTHLQVVERLSDRQVRVRFMHKQTFGFMAFNLGDEITFLHRDSMQTFGENIVKEAVLENERDMLLSMERDLPEGIDDGDAIENVTWTPEVKITGCTVKHIPTRGFLLTTRRSVLVENNTFHRTRMFGILIENDAQGWYESGPVRDMTIRGNRFLHCREPVIHINPRNSVPNPAVHQNIRVIGNQFLLKDQYWVGAKSTTGLELRDNIIYSDVAKSDPDGIKTHDCAEVVSEGNRYRPKAEWKD